MKSPIRKVKVDLEDMGLYYIISKKDLNKIYRYIGRLEQHIDEFDKFWKDMEEITR